LSRTAECPPSASYASRVSQMHWPFAIFCDAKRERVTISVPPTAAA
jgi:hypothetical protein